LARDPAHGTSAITRLAPPNCALRAAQGATSPTAPVRRAFAVEAWKAQRMADFELTDEQYDDLFRVIQLYNREARRCRAGGAPLAGCVMIGAAVEATLLAMANCYSDEVLASEVKPTRKGAPKPLIDWSLAQLLRVAKDLNWLPSQLALEEEFDGDRAEIGDYVEILRMVRNLVHPARHIVDLPRGAITKRYLSLAFDVLDAAEDFLSEKVYGSLRTVLDEE
jgi:hypothetical protein